MKDCCGILLMKEVTWMLPKQNAFCEKDDTIIRPERGDDLSRAISTNMTTKYIPSCNNKMKREVMGSGDNGNVWIENSNANAKSSLRFI